MTRLFAFLLGSLWIAVAASAQPFLLPTSNRSLYEPNGGEKYFIGTVGRTWTSGMFGCVRSEGWQMHEGIDIACLQRDRQGEPIDPILATADGTVAYINDKPGLSNYGNYLILRHRVEGLEIFSMYAHLRSFAPGLKVGQKIQAGETIAVMGRTANTRQAISKERAHLHFELNFLVNDRFEEYYKKTFPGQRNDHGTWNGQNLLAFDPYLVFLAQKEKGVKFSLLHHIRNQTELCRVVVRDTRFPWLQRYTPLIMRNSVAEREGIAGYELALNYNGIPYQLIPRAASEIKGAGKYTLLSVNEEEYKKNPCRKLVSKKGDRWELAASGARLLDLLTY